MKIYNGMSWHEFLRGSLREYRDVHPTTTLTDWEILTELMEHLVDAGLVRKSTGKYVVGRIGYVQ